jgi:hypothetical protein
MLQDLPLDGLPRSSAGATEVSRRFRRALRGIASSPEEFLEAESALLEEFAAGSRSPLRLLGAARSELRYRWRNHANRRADVERAPERVDHLDPEAIFLEREKERLALDLIAELPERDREALATYQDSGNYPGTALAARRQRARKKILERLSHLGF